MVNQLIQKKGKTPIGKETPKPIIVSPSIINLESKLQQGFGNFNEGMAAFLGLKKEHDALLPLLTNRAVADTLVNTDRLKTLTDSLYLQGLTLLLQTLDISQQVGATNTTALELETKELKEDLDKCSSASIKTMIEERLEKNTKCLKLVKSHRDRLDEILMQVGLCKDSIREIRLELPELLNHKAQDELDKVMLELKTRIEFAQRVHEEYTKQGL